MDQQGTTMSELAGVKADLVDLAPMTRRPHGAFEDPTTPAGALPRESIEQRTIAFHAA
jgi:hypothetical protein